MVINHELHVVHDLGIAAVSLLGHLGDAGSISKHTGGLGVENERYGQEALDPFCISMSAERFCYGHEGDVEGEVEVTLITEWGKGERA